MVMLVEDRTSAVIGLNTRAVDMHAVGNGAVSYGRNDVHYLVARR